MHAGYDRVPRKGGIYRVQSVVQKRGREFLKLQEFSYVVFVSSAFEKLSPASSEFSEKIKGFGGGVSRREKQREVESA